MLTHGLMDRLRRVRLMVGGGGGGGYVGNVSAMAVMVIVLVVIVAAVVAVTTARAGAAYCGRNGGYHPAQVSTDRIP